MRGRRAALTLAVMRTLIAVAACFLLVACGSSEEPEAEQEAAPKVSTATTCGQLFDGEAPGEQVVDLMTAEASPSDDETAEALADELDPIAQQAGEETAAHVEVVARELREYAEVTAGETFETDEIVTSLTDLNNVCGVTPRFN